MVAQGERSQHSCMNWYTRQNLGLNDRLQATARVSGAARYRSNSEPSKFIV